LFCSSLTVNEMILNCFAIVCVFLQGPFLDYTCMCKKLAFWCYVFDKCVFVIPVSESDSSCVLCVELQDRDLYMLTLMRSLRVNCAFDCALVRVTALVPVAILAMAEIHKKSKVLKINVSVGFPLNFIK